MIDRGKPNLTIGSKTFLIAWMIIGLMGWQIGNFLNVVMIEIFTIDVFVNRSTQTIVIVFNAFIMLVIVGLLQMFILNRFLGSRIKHWWWVTALSFAVCTAIVHPLSTDFILMYRLQYSKLELFLTVSLFSTIFTHGIVSLLQALLLKSYIKYVALYVILTLVFRFFTSLAAMYHEIQLTLVIAILYFVSIGLTLIWLNRLTNTEEKSNNMQHTM